MAYLPNHERTAALPASTHDQIKALQQEFQERDPGLRGKGVDTTIRLSAIKAAVDSEKINPAGWATDNEANIETTISELEKVLPQTPARFALIKGLQTEIQRQKGQPLSLDQIRLVDQAIKTLALIKKQLLERSILKKKTKEKKEEWTKGGVINNLSEGFGRISEKWDDLSGGQKLLAGGVALLGIFGIYKAFFSEKDGESSFLSHAVRLGAAFAVAEFGTRWYRKDGKGLVGTVVDAVKGMFSGNTAHAATGIPTTEQLKQTGLDGNFEQEIAALSDVKLEKVIKEWNRARNAGETKINRHSLGIGSNFQQISDEELFQLADKLLKGYPKKLAKDGHLVPDEKKMVDRGEGWRLVQKWYLEDKFIVDKNLRDKMTFGHLWRDFMLDDPPPGRELERM